MSFEKINRSFFLMILLQILALTLAFRVAQAQDFGRPADPMNHLQQTGRLVEVKIVPKDKKTMIYVVGKKTAQLKWDRLNMEATLYLPNNVSRKLTLKKDKDAFIHEGLLSEGELSLDLKEITPGESETLKFQLKRP